MSKIKKISALCFGVQVLSACSIFGSRPKGESLNKMKDSPQFDGEKGVFANKNSETMKMGPFFAMLQDYYFGEQERVPKSPLPEVQPNLEEFSKPAKEAKFIWLGHSSFLIRLGGQTILVDPVFSEYASPIPLFAKRFQAPVLSFNNLPPVDVIVISHDHYDHLDMNTIKHFRGLDTQFVTPLGVGSHLSSWGIAEKLITELDWWDTTSISGVDYTCTPAQHFSGRGLKRNETLWASWAITNQDQKIFYSGDSGYSEHYKQIGERIGPFELAFLENGQYNKNWPHVHQTPEEAIQASVDLRVKAVVPVHWGMFELSSHDWFEPVDRMVNAARGSDIKVYTPRIGELVDLKEPPMFAQWWPETPKDKEIEKKSTKNEQRPSSIKSFALKKKEGNQ